VAGGVGGGACDDVAGETGIPVGGRWYGDVGIGNGLSGGVEDNSADGEEWVVGRDEPRDCNPWAWESGGDGSWCEEGLLSKEDSAGDGEEGGDDKDGGDEFELGGEQHGGGTFCELEDGGGDGGCGGEGGLEGGCCELGGRRRSGEELGGCEGGGEKEVALGETGADFLQGAVEAFFGGGFGGVGELRNFEERAVVDVTEEKRVTLVSGEFVDDLIEVEFEIGGGGSNGDCGVHAGGLLLTAFAAGFDALGVGAGVLGDFVKPADEWDAGFDCCRALCEEKEDGLSDIFGTVRVAQKTTGVGEDGGKVAVDELGEGFGGAGFGEVAQEDAVILSDSGRLGGGGHH